MLAEEKKPVNPFFFVAPKEGIPQHAWEHRWEQLHVGWQSGGGALLCNSKPEELMEDVGHVVLEHQ